MCLVKVINYIKICGILTIVMQFAQAKSLANSNHLKEFYTQNVSSITGVQQMKLLRDLVNECQNSSQNSSLRSTFQCLKHTSLHLIEDITTRNVVPVWRGVRFVRENNYANYLSHHNDLWNRMDLQYLTWFDRLALNFGRLLSTHRLEINVKELAESYMQFYRQKDQVGSARHRRQRFNMMVTMMFGVTALGSVLVPMGFQLLSVVSGKALLLAKLALLLASINGLKRVANTGLHYGLYHVPSEHYGGYYDRGDVPHPRNVQVPNNGNNALEM